MNLLPAKISILEKSTLCPDRSTDCPKRSRVSFAFFWHTQDGEKGWGAEFPPAIFRKSFACLAKAARFLSRPIPLFISILRGDGLVGKAVLVARQVKHSFEAGGNGL